MSEAQTQPKIAIVCDWLTNWGGAERCLMALHEIWPDAPIYTLMYDSQKMPEFRDADIRTSFLQKIPFARKRWRYFLHYMPFAIEQFDLSAYDIVISTSHVVAKGAITKPSSLHICYLYSPTRYLWDYAYQYLNEVRFSRFGFINKTLNAVVRMKLHHIRGWDQLASQRPDFFVSISEYIRRRTHKYYRRDSDVIYPPVEMQRFAISPQVEDFYLVVGRQAPYKKTDIVIEAFNKMKKKLIVIGDGPEIHKLKKIAGPTVTLTGRLPDEQVARYYATCKGFIFPQEEDFGITPLEAQACGRPVIAYRAGGVLETVTENETGIFFDKQTPEAIVAAVERFETQQFSPATIRAHAQTFDTTVFKEKMQKYVAEKYQQKREGKEPSWK